MELLQDYEPGKDMGKDWYILRIMYLIDQVNHLTEVRGSDDQ